MIQIFIISHLILNTFCFLDANGNVYTSGLNDNTPHPYVLPSTKNAVLGIPFKFSCNAFERAIMPGMYELNPVYVNSQPVTINLIQQGEIRGKLSVVDYKQLDYQKSFSSAELELINNGTMAQITIKMDNFIIYSIIKTNME